MKKSIIGLLCGLVVLSIGGVIFWYSTKEDTENAIPDCDPVVEAPVIIINDIPKTCHTGEMLWGTIPEIRWGYELPPTAIYNHKAYVGQSEFTDDKEYETGICKRGEYIFKEMKDQKDYKSLLDKYDKNNLLGFYGLSQFSLLTIYPSAYYEKKDTYENISNKTLSTLNELGYKEGYISFEHYRDGKATFAFNEKLYSPFYDTVDQNLLDKIRNNVNIELHREHEYTGVQQSYSSPWKITGFTNKKLIFTRQKNIMIKRDNNGHDISLVSGNIDYKHKYGDNYGYIASYNIETCIEN